MTTSQSQQVINPQQAEQTQNIKRKRTEALAVMFKAAAQVLDAKTQPPQPIQHIAWSAKTRLATSKLPSNDLRQGSTGVRGYRRYSRG